MDGCRVQRRGEGSDERDGCLNVESWLAGRLAGWLGSGMDGDGQHSEG